MEGWLRQCQARNIPRLRHHVLHTKYSDAVCGGSEEGSRWPDRLLLRAAKAFMFRIVRWANVFLLIRVHEIVTTTLGVMDSAGIVSAGVLPAFAPCRHGQCHSRRT